MKIDVIITDVVIINLIGRSHWHTKLHTKIDMRVLEEEPIIKQTRRNKNGIQRIDKKCHRERGTSLGITRDGNRNEKWLKRKGE